MQVQHDPGATSDSNVAAASVQPRKRGRPLGLEMVCTAHLHRSDEAVDDGSINGDRDTQGQPLKANLGTQVRKLYRYINLAGC